MLRDTPPLYPAAPTAPAPPAGPPGPHAAPQHRYAANTALDDVFGGASPPPPAADGSTRRPSAEEGVARGDEGVTSGEGREEQSEEQGDEQREEQRQRQRHGEVSDVPRLRRAHATAGYRDGIAAAKGASAQAGFDEGFGLGAELGLRAGRVLGVLEGLARALAAGGGGGAEGGGERPGRTTREEAGEEARRLLGAARSELARPALLGEEWFDGEGVWRFGGAGGGAEGTFRDVADAHPVLERWRGVVEELAARWGVDLGVLGRRDRGDDDEG